MVTLFTYIHMHNTHVHIHTHACTYAENSYTKLISKLVKIEHHVV